VPLYAPSIQVARRFGSQVEVVTPPYRSSSPLRSLRATDDVPLGTVICGTGDTTLAVLAELTASTYRWPWVVPCIALPIKHEPLEPLLMLVTELRDRLAVVKESRRTGPVAPAAIVAAVRQRAMPTAHGLARWIAQRLNNGDLEIPLCSQFREALEGVAASNVVSVSTYCRLFARHGRYTARDWRAVACLCAHAVATEHPRRSLRDELQLRAARHYTRKYLGLPYQVMTERVGWEWVLEAALRKGRYS
jgi:hypothetical protein